MSKFHTTINKHVTMKVMHHAMPSAPEGTITDADSDAFFKLVLDSDLLSISEIKLTDENVYELLSC